MIGVQPVSEAVVWWTLGGFTLGLGVFYFLVFVWLDRRNR